MTVSVTSTSLYLTFNGYRSSYDITFNFNSDPSLIAAYIMNDSGIRKLAVTEYSVEVKTQDTLIYGTFHLTDSTLSFKKLLIRRETPLSQESTFYSQTQYGKVTEGALDKVTRAMQEMADRTIDIEVIDKENTLLGFDGDGDLSTIKAGENIKIDDDTISATITDPYILPIATKDKLGGVKIGKNIDATGDGTISVADPYILPVADAGTLGGVKIGANIDVTEDGTISVENSPGGGEPYKYAHVDLGTRIHYSKYNMVKFFPGVGFILLGNNGMVHQSLDGISIKFFNDRNWENVDFGYLNMKNVTMANDAGKHRFVFYGQTTTHGDFDEQSGYLFFDGETLEQALEIRYCYDLVTIKDMNGREVVVASFKDSTRHLKILFRRLGYPEWTIIDAPEKLTHLLWVEDISGEAERNVLYGVGDKKVFASYVQSNYQHFEQIGPNFAPDDKHVRIVDMFTCEGCEGEEHQYPSLLDISGTIYVMAKSYYTEELCWRYRHIKRKNDGRSFSRMIARYNPDDDKYTYVVIGAKGAMMVRTMVRTIDNDIKGAFGSTRSRKYWIPNITNQSLTSVCVGENLNSGDIKEKVCLVVGDRGQIARSTNFNDFVLVNESSVNYKFHSFKKIIYDPYKKMYYALMFDGNSKEPNGNVIGFSKDCTNWEFSRTFLEFNFPSIREILPTPTCCLFPTGYELYRTTDFITASLVFPKTGLITPHNLIYSRTNGIFFVGSSYKTVFRSTDGGLTFTENVTSTSGDIKLCTRGDDVWGTINNQICYFNEGDDTWDVKAASPLSTSNPYSFIALSQNKFLVARNLKEIYLYENGEWHHIPYFGLGNTDYIREIAYKKGYVVMASDSHLYSFSTLFGGSHKHDPEYQKSYKNRIRPLMLEGARREIDESRGNIQGIIGDDNEFVAYGSNIIYMVSSRKSKNLYRVF
ncbi:MAG: hypothetical protein LBJ80_00125 [Rickettsiales bacterium]|jgi:hypothetical protein|nr:hypothetical protein [Rickettsiales bacterium]